MNSRYLSLGKAALALSLMGCTQASLPKQPAAVAPAMPEAAPVWTAPAPDQQTIPTTTPGKFTLPDGSLNYDALRAAYGEPNKHVVLNPKATDISHTASIHSVKAEPGRLVFAAADAKWLLSGHGPGDTLYCGARCDGTGFLRNVTSIRPQGDEVIVETTDGTLTDVIHGGWIHGSHIVTFDASEDEKQQLLHDPRNIINLGNCDATSDTIQVCYSAQKSGDLLPTYTKSWPFNEPFPGGNIGGTASISVTVTYDINVELGIDANIDISSGDTSVKPLFKISLFKVQAVATPDLQLHASYAVTEAYSQDWTPVNINQQNTINLIPNVDIDSSVVIKLAAHVDASAAATIIATAETSDTLTAGAQYSDGTLSPIFSNSFNPPTYSLNVNGNASAHAYAGLTVNMSLSIAGFGLNLGGPSLTATGGAGVIANASASNSGGTCQLKIAGEAFLKFSGDVALNFGLPGFSISYPYNFPTIDKTYTPPNFPITKTLKSSFCSTGNFDAGGQQECPTGANMALQLCPSATPSCCATGSGGYACVDETSDANNCGLCNYSCANNVAPGSTCSMGTCSCSCPQGSTTANPGDPCPGGTIEGCF